MAEAHSAPGTQASSIKVEPPGTELESKIFQKVISSGLTVKAQQRGEPDLTEGEKVATLSSLLRDKPGAFLMRYGKVLESEHLDYFTRSSDYEVTFRVNELRKHLVPANRMRRTRNRRFECMKELMDTDYFTEEEMRQRNPLLFTHYVGQYMSEEELGVMDGSTTSDMALSSHILRRMRQDERIEKEKKQGEREEEQQEEEEEDTSSDEDNDQMEASATPEVTENEKRYLKQQFLQAMQLSFLRGEDKDFDYSVVDTNENYDSVETQQQDGEDRYFDEEEPQWCTSQNDTLSEPIS